ncbi:MAG TPA: hypothetical protein VHM25_02050, partial [Polyangiaceae bacterium]|nr:hypothetical protein [Polyangiaceae bacterium]
MLIARAYSKNAKILPRVPLIMGAAAQSQVLNRVRPTDSKRLDVVELETPARTATSPIRRDIAALLAITQKHRAQDRRGIATFPLGIDAPLWEACEFGWLGRG